MTEKSNARFNDEAAAWDNNPDVHRASESAREAIVARFPQLQEAQDKGNAGQGLEVLEIGCGTGLLSLRIAPYVRSLLAVDSAKGMIDALNIKLSQPDSVKNVTALCVMLENPEDPTLPPASSSAGGATNGSSGPRKKFDLILSHLVLHHIPDLALVLKTMYGCLKPGGYVALTDYEDFGPEARKFHPEAKMDGVERHGIDKKWFAGLMKDQGFEDVSCEPAWVMRKDAEKVPGQWGQKKPTKEDLGEDLFEMDFPFLLCVGRKPE